MHGFTCMLLLLHSAFMLSVVKILLKREVGGCELNNHGNYIVDHGKSWKSHGIVFFNSCGNPVFARTKLIFRERKIFYFMEIITCAPSIYTMDHPDLTVSNFMEKYIDLQMVQYYGDLTPWMKVFRINPEFRIWGWLSMKISLKMLN